MQNTDMITSEVEAYLRQKMTAVDPDLLALYQASESIPQGHIQSSLMHANLFRLLIGLLNAKLVLELGTFTGFSALAMAKALPGDGKVITCELDETRIKFGKAYWARAQVDQKIDVLLGPAKQSLEHLLQKHREAFDLCYIDANKSQYLEYYQLCFELTRVGGLIVVDNTLFKAEVLKPASNNMVKGIQALNDYVANDPCVTALILPLSDGVSLIRKEKKRG